MPSHPQDLQLVRDALAGSSESRERFALRMECVARILAEKNRRLGGPLNSSELEDVVQDTVTSIWRRLKSYEGMAALETWAYRFCQYELANRLRRRSRSPEKPLSLEDEELVDPQHRKQLDHDEVYQALDRVGGEEAVVVRLKHFEQMSFSEIGVRLQIATATAKSRYYRAMKRLEILLRPQHREVES